MRIDWRVIAKGEEMALPGAALDATPEFQQIAGCREEPMACRAARMVEFKPLLRFGPLPDQRNGDARVESNDGPPHITQAKAQGVLSPPGAAATNKYFVSSLAARLGGEHCQTPR